MPLKFTLLKYQERDISNEFLPQHGEQLHTTVLNAEEKMRFTFHF